jgi:hypothetical protein
LRSIILLIHADWRLRRASWISLAVLIALIGGTVLCGASAASRTSTALPQFVSHYGYDLEVVGVQKIPKAFSEFPHVQRVIDSRYYFNGNLRGDGKEISDDYVNLLSQPRDATTTIKLLSGRWPTASRDVLIGYSLEQRYGLHLGSIVTAPFYRLSQRNSILSSVGETAPPPHGPRVRFRVVGIEASLLDFPSATPSYAIYTSAAFDRHEGRDVVSVAFAQMRLSHVAKSLSNVQVLINNYGKHGSYFVYQTTDNITSAIEGAVHPQVVGWWFFALFAALAGLALIGQALARQSFAERASLPILSALGLRKSQLFRVGMFRAAALGTIGALGALATAYLLSPLTPVGEARAAVSARGFYFDSAVMGLGVPLILLAVLALAAMPAWRATQAHSNVDARELPPTGGGSRIARGLGAFNVGPSVLIGVRNALERGRGRTSVPVVTALVGTVLAVAALIASGVFGASLSRLLSTPALYGANWQVNLENVPTNVLHSALREMDRNANVIDVNYGSQGKLIDVDGDSVPTVYVDVAKGTMVYSLASGRHPSRAGQIDLGASVLAHIRAHEGSVVSVSIVGLKGGNRTSKVKVVGTVVIPPSVGLAGLGGGAVLTIPGIEDLACGGGAKARPCVQNVNRKLDQGDDWDVVVKVTSDRAGRATALALKRRYAPYVAPETIPTNLVNFGEAVDFPLLLSVTLAVFGVVTLAHLLFVSVGRRRRQFAILKVLGFTRGQVRSALYWQATTDALVGVIFGVPLGILVGKVIWNEFATSAGAVPFAVVPGWHILYQALAIVVVAIGLASIPALLGARIQPGEALRES